MNTRPCNYAASGCDYPAGECGGACTSRTVLGPWEACGNLIRTKREADGTGGFLVAEIPANTGDTTAKAMAMAAAPELIEALKRCRFDSLNMSLEDMRFCRAALAKATGEQS